MQLQSTTDPILIFDISDKVRFNREHIPGSKFAVCDEQTINTLLPQLPKDIDIVLVGEDEKYLYDMAKLGREKGTLNTRYLKGGLAAWKWGRIKEEDPRISAYDLKRQGLDNGFINQGKIFLLDVRTQDEFKGWNIEGSQNISMAEVPQSLRQIPKNKEIVTICPNGNRSGMITLMLQRLGYNNVKTLEGGLKSWSSTLEYTSKVFNIFSSPDLKVRVVQIRRIGKGCISYIIGQEENRQGEGVVGKEVYSDGTSNNNRKEIIVMDPVFPAEDYVRIANEELCSNNITKVLDTHLHADHVSAARDLASKTNAKLYVSSYEDYLFTKKGKEKEQNYNLLYENDIIDISSKETQQLLVTRVIHTPGHTAGGLSFLLGDNLLFTGDTLFINSIGRPDLKDKAKEFANMLYDTLHNKIFNLANKENILVFPTHMEGNVREEELVTDSLANIEKRSKYHKLTRDEFVKKMVSITMPTPPQYKDIISMNRGEKTLPSVSEIHNIEMGPNRCGVSG